MAKSINLFGELQEMDVSAPKSVYQRFKSMNHYRESTGHSRCKNCLYLLKMEYHGKNYYKCELMGVSNSEATDIKLKMVCNKWLK